MTAAASILDVDNRTVLVTRFDDEWARIKREERLTLPELMETILAAAADEKSRLPWLKLAAFGEVRSSANCLRHDANVRKISGVELDYDGGRVSFDEAVEAAKRAALRALIYTTPSHNAGKPHWRALLPTSEELAPDRRLALARRAMAAFGCEFDPKSEGLSQSYYYGCVTGSPPPRAAIVDGAFIDRLDDAAGVPSEEEAAIPEGERDTRLTSLAGTMRRRGFERAAIEAALLAENAAKCRPPLPEQQVRKIARSVSRYAPADGGSLVLDPKAPLVSARKFIDSRYRRDGARTLHHHGGSFYAWDGTCYPEADEAEIRAGLYAFLDGARRPASKGKTAPFEPNRAKVADALDALAAAANLPGSVRPPAWLGDAADLPAGEIIACANGLLHMPTRELLPHTPEFFTHNALDVAFDPKAPEPNAWLAFLASLWPDDEESVAALQEAFGYCLTADTRQQKAFLIVGPKRSGKGTVARALARLVGAENVAGPPLASLGATFGLQPLIGKRVAMISDARLGRRADVDTIVERLLSISGEDVLTVDRKNRAAWTGHLTVRFLVLSNDIARQSG